MNESEVARLLAQIDAEYVAAERGLTGLSSGASQHAFLTARTEHICQLHQELRSLAGDDVMMLVNQAQNSPSRGKSPLS